MSAAQAAKLDDSSQDGWSQSSSDPGEDSEICSSIHSDTESDEEARQTDEDFIEIDAEDDLLSTDDYAAETSSTGSSEYWSDAATESEVDTSQAAGSEPNPRPGQVDQVGSLMRRRQAASSVERTRRRIPVLRLDTAIATLAIDDGDSSEREKLLDGSESEGSLD